LTSVYPPPYLLTVTVNRTHSLAALVPQSLTGNTTGKEWNETNSVTEVIQYKRMRRRNGRIRMQSGTHKRTGIAALCTVALLLTTAIPSYSGAITDSFQSIAEQAWMEQYIPRSDEETLPLTDFDNFEVTELFRAETIENLEASLTDGYPMPWLEEILKDTTIPWEDRYWLDCRVRAAIAQNTHTFFNPAGTPVHIDADAVFPGEYYWQEHMIVDPAGYSVQIREDEEGYRLPDEGRPVLPRVNSIDIGFIYNLFGRKKGDLALSFNGMSLSRDGSLGLHVTGQTSDRPSSYDQMYACLMYPDGSFREIPLPQTGRQYSGTISGDGNTIVLFPASRSGSAIEVLNRDGNLIKTIRTGLSFENISKPSITDDGRYASCWYRPELEGGHSAVIDIANGLVRFTSKHNIADINSIECNFSADGDYFCIGGMCEARVVNLRDGSERSFSDTALREGKNNYTRIKCSNSGTVVAYLGNRSSGSLEQIFQLRIIALDSEVYSERIENTWDYGHHTPDVSPNGNFVFLNDAPDWLGVHLGESPSVVYQVSGRRN